MICVTGFGAGDRAAVAGFFITWLSICCWADASDYGLKVIEAARVNTNAAFDFAGELITAKTLSEVIELSSAHARKQFEAFTEQSKELSALVQKVATETAEPIKSGVNRAFSKVA